MNENTHIVMMAADRIFQDFIIISGNMTSDRPGVVSSMSLRVPGPKNSPLNTTNSQHAIPAVHLLFFLLKILLSTE